ncbi:MAG: hypothetical protein IE922_05885 [Sphingomonadales bacterium]|nr:hypothetical protein [Sphingomonadales bacterium]
MTNRITALSTGGRVFVAAAAVSARGGAGAAYRAGAFGAAGRAVAGIRRQA